MKVKEFFQLCNEERPELAGYGQDMESVWANPQLWPWLRLWIAPRALNERALWLYCCCWCVRQVWDLLEEPGRAALEAAEKLVRGQVPEDLEQVSLAATMWLRDKVNEKVVGRHSAGLYAAHAAVRILHAPDYHCHPAKDAARAIACGAASGSVESAFRTAQASYLLAHCKAQFKDNSISSYFYG